MYNVTSDLKQSFKAKIRAIAKEKNCDPAELWQSLTLERFLVRLAKSPYCEHFILKGGILLSRYIEIGRETTDLDFLAQKISNDINKLKNTFEEIAGIDLLDGFSFQEIKVKELKHPHMNYSGVQVNMKAFFGSRTRFNVTIDLGFGDIIESIKYTFPLTSYSKGNLFEGNIDLLCYSKEFIFAEKLETIFFRGSFNTRMKDFHDLYSMITSYQSRSFENLERIIYKVFQHRETKLELPISYEDDEIKRMQNYWSEYLKNLRSDYLERLPARFVDVIRKINDWLLLNIKIASL